MGLKVWRGDAQARADVWWVTPVGVGPGDRFTLTINGKSIHADAGEQDASGEATDVTAEGIVQLLLEKIQDSDIPEWNEVEVSMGFLDSTETVLTPATVDGTTLVITGPDNGTPITISGETTTFAEPVVTVTEVTKGVAPANEVQQIDIPAWVASGTFTLTLAGQTSGAIAYDASAATVEAALEALSTIGAGNVSVSGASPTWLAEFQGALAATNVATMTGSGASLAGPPTIEVEEITPGSSSTPEIQRIKVLSISPGHYIALRYDGYTDVANPFLPETTDPTATAAYFGGTYTPTRCTLIQRTLLNGAWTVEWEVEWGGVHAGEDIPQFQAYEYFTDTYGTYGWLVSPYDQSSTSQGGGTGGIDEVQRVTVPKAVAGTFTLTCEGTTTGAITFSATGATLATNIAAALNTALGASSVSAALHASSATEIAVDVTFDGTGYTGRDIDLMTGDGTNLTGGYVLVVTTQAAVAAVNEVQQIELPDNPSGGTFTLSYGGTKTAAIAYNANAAAIDSAIEAVTGAGTVTVTGDMPSSEVTFGGALAATDVALLVGDGHNLVVTGTQTLKLRRPCEYTYTAGDWDATTHVFTVPTGGHPVNDGVAVGDPATVCVDDEIGGAPYLARVTARDATTITLSADTIEGTEPATSSSGDRTCMVGVTAPTGPHHWDDDANWEPSGVPVDDDAVVFQASSVSCLYGMNQSSVTPGSITFYASFTGDIGLPFYNENEYLEYRPRSLQIGDATDSATLPITIGGGSGDGSKLIRIDTNACQTVLKVTGTGNPSEDNATAVAWIGTHVSNTVEVTRGSVGVAIYAGESAAIATLTVGWQTDRANDSEVTIGSGVSTITSIVKTGGNLDLSASFTTLTQSGGETVFRSGTAGTLTAQAGDVQYQSSGNCTTLAAYDSTIDFSGGNAAITITNATLYAGAGLIDSGKRVTFTNPPALKCRISDLEVLDLGTDFSLQRS